MKFKILILTIAGSLFIFNNAQSQVKGSHLTMSFRLSRGNCSVNFMTLEVRELHITTSTALMAVADDLTLQMEHILTSFG